MYASAVTRRTSRRCGSRSDSARCSTRPTSCPRRRRTTREFYEHLLRRNAKLVGAQFCVGAENAVFLVGSFPVGAIDDEELDRIVGSLYAYVEQCFRPALRIGYASRFV